MTKEEDAMYEYSFGGKSQKALTDKEAL